MAKTNTGARDRRGHPVLVADMHTDPREAFLRAQAHLEAAERELADARAALAVAGEVLAVADQPPPSAQLDLYTVSETALRLSLGKSTVEKMVAAGEIRSITVGGGARGARRVPRRAVEEYIEQRLAAS